MKIIRYLDPEQEIQLACEHPDGSRERLSGELLASPRPTGEAARVAKVLAPLLPAAILCIGLNYRAHAEETGAAMPEFPVLFFKGTNALLHPGESIELPTFLASDQVDCEGELAVVIGRTCKNARREQALDYVLGYTCANDVSARDWQKERGGGQWCRGKTFDTFAPLGPCLVTREEIPNPNALGIRTVLNGERVQDSSTAEMIFDVPALIEFLSGSTTLLPGTVILTGTPPGVGMAATPPRWLRAGDTVAVEIEGIGRLTNPVALEA